MIEPKQNITKEYAVAYSILAYNSLITRVPKKDRNLENMGHQMVLCMRKYTPKDALKNANKLLYKKEKKEF